MALLSRDEIFAVDDLKLEEVEVPEWGGEVIVRSLTGSERDEFEASTVKTDKSGKRVPDLENFRARLVSLCMIDDKGQRLCKSRAETIALGNKSVIALDRVFAVAQKLNGMAPAKVEEIAEDLDEASDPNEPSTSD